MEEAIHFLDFLPGLPENRGQFRSFRNGESIDSFTTGDECLEEALYRCYENMLSFLYCF